MADERPQCGGRVFDEGQYNVPLHIAAIFIVLAVGIVGGTIPMMAKRYERRRILYRVFLVCKYFGMGVLIATVFAHLIPAAFKSLTHPCLDPFFTETYPALAGVVIMISLFAFLAVDVWLGSKPRVYPRSNSIASNWGSSIGGSRLDISSPLQKQRDRFSASSSSWTGQEQYQKPAVTELNKDFLRSDPAPISEMPPWFVVFYEQYVRQREEMMENITQAISASRSPPEQEGRNTFSRASTYQSDIEEYRNEWVVLGRPDVKIIIVAITLVLYTAIVGVTVSITAQGFTQLLIAFTFHQMLQAVTLGASIAETPFVKGSFTPWVLVAAFGVAAPIGQAVGLAVRQSYDPGSSMALVLVGILSAIASGVLIYAALVCVLNDCFFSEEGQALPKSQKTVALFCALLGAAAVSVISAFAKAG